MLELEPISNLNINNKHFLIFYTIYNNRDIHIFDSREKYFDLYLEDLLSLNTRYNILGWCTPKDLKIKPLKKKYKTAFITLKELRTLKTTLCKEGKNKIDYLINQLDYNKKVKPEDYEIPLWLIADILNVVDFVDGLYALNEDYILLQLVSLFDFTIDDIEYLEKGKLIEYLKSAKRAVFTV